MKIFIDGPDAIGKSTLARYLSNKYDLNLYHMTSGNKNDYAEHLDFITRDENLLCDRFCGGEYVYPHIFNRQAKLSNDEFNRLFEEMQKHNCVYVVLYAKDINMLKSRLDARGEEYDDIELQNQLFREYAQYLPKRDSFLSFELSDVESYNRMFYALDKLCKGDVC